MNLQTKQALHMTLKQERLNRSTRRFLVSEVFREMKSKPKEDPKDILVDVFTKWYENKLLRRGKA